MPSRSRPFNGPSRKPFREPPRRIPLLTAMLAGALAVSACTDFQSADASGPAPGPDASGKAPAFNAADNSTPGRSPLLVRVAAQADAPADETPPTAGSPYGDFLAARQAERDFNATLAAKLYARVLAHAPDNPALQRQAMHQMIAAGMIPDAARVAEVYARHEPDSVMAGLALAVEELTRGDTESASQRLAAMPRQGLGGYFVPLALAWTRAGRGDTDGALLALEPMKSLRGGAIFHDFHAALILDRKGDAKGALPYLDKLEEQNYAGYVRVAEMVGPIYERAGMRDKAEKLYRTFEEHHPGSLVIDRALARLEAGEPAPREIETAAEGTAEAFANMATLLSQEGVNEIAMMLARMALALKPDFPTAQLLVGDILDSVGRDTAAIAAYDSIDRDAPLSWPARLRAAQLLDQGGRTDVAVARLRDMAGEKPERTDALVALGDLYRFKKRYEEAVEAYDAAFARLDEATERNWGLHYSRGIALERARKWDRAEADFLKALDYRPEQPFVLNYLGYSWIEQGEHLERALDMIERAVKLRPNDGYITDSLGWAHYQLSDFGKAVQYLERAVELTPRDSTINDHLGDAYWRVGRHYEARFQWRRALALGPEPGDVGGIEKKLSDGLPPAPDKKGARRDGTPGGEPRGG